jgi:hypothetical protein
VALGNGIFGNLTVLYSIESEMSENLTLLSCFRGGISTFGDFFLLFDCFFFFVFSSIIGFKLF